MRADKGVEVSGLHHRRRALVEAAFRCIAERGFEGLRLRVVSEEVGIDHSTLHHYFPTKEDLVSAVLAYVTDQFSATMPEGTNPEDRLRGHLRALAELVAERPALFTVAAEFDLRARRDPVTLTILERDEQGWRAGLTELLQRGIDTGAWADGIEVAAGVELIIAVVKGARLSPQGAGTALSELARLLIAADRWPATGMTPHERTST